MFVTLIALVIMMLASIALIRSTDTNLLIAGHLSFKRDLLNQAERSIPIIRNQFRAGGLLPSEFSRIGDNAAANYLATIQPGDINAYGIPNILLNTTAFDSAFPNNNIVDNDAKITIRYVIDRMCLAPGVVTAANCTLSLTTQNTSGTGIPGPPLPGVNLPVYRISMRITGPRNTETYLQTSFRN